MAGRRPWRPVRPLMLFHPPCGPVYHPFCVLTTRTHAKLCRASHAWSTPQQRVADVDTSHAQAGDALRRARRQTIEQLPASPRCAPTRPAADLRRGEADAGSSSWSAARSGSTSRSRRQHQTAADLRGEVSAISFVLAASTAFGAATHDTELLISGAPSSTGSRPQPGHATRSSSGRRSSPLLRDMDEKFVELIAYVTAGKK